MIIVNELKMSFNLPLYEMANIKRTDTGLSADIWVDSNGDRRKPKHNSPRLKIKSGSQSAVLSIEKNPQIIRPKTDKEKDKIYRNFKDTIDFVGEYYETFEKHFYNQISDYKLFKELEEKGAFNRSK